VHWRQRALARYNDVHCTCMCASSHSHKRPVFFLHFAVDEQCLYCVQVSQSLLPMRRAALHPLEQHRKMTGRGRDTEVIVGVGVSVGV